MSTAFLCVQFRNALPAEQLVLLARALWSDLLAAGVPVSRGDAVLSIAQRPGDLSYDVELTLPGAPRRGVAHAADPHVAVDEAFALWRRDHGGPAGLDDALAVDESATAALSVTGCQVVLTHPGRRSRSARCPALRKRQSRTTPTSRQLMR